MRVTVTGATGLIGSALVAELRSRGDEVTVLSRDPDAALAALEGPGPGALLSERWDPLSEPAPAAALAGRDAVVHLAGENVAQRWTAAAKQRILDSRVIGTRQLVSGLRAAKPRPRVLASSSAIGYYGPHGDEPLDEDAPPGHDFLAEVCVAWEAEARAAEELGLRVALVRTGVVLDRDGGALAKMLPAFRAGVGGPIAGGHQYVSWIHRDDLVGIILAALDDEAYSGPLNAVAPEPVTNRELSHALGHALHRPALVPVPGLALRLMYGQMADTVTTGMRAMPARPLVLGYRFRYPRLEDALSAALG